MPANPSNYSTDLRILVVDDDPDEFPLLEAGFGDCRATAGNGATVSLQMSSIAHLALIEFALCESGRRPDLALVDINMPAIDGFGLAREFISNGLPTILMSTQVDDERRARATALGALALLEKPGSAHGYAAMAARVLHLVGRAAV